MTGRLIFIYFFILLSYVAVISVFLTKSFALIFFGFLFFKYSHRMLASLSAWYCVCVSERKIAHYVWNSLHFFVCVFVSVATCSFLNAVLFTVWSLACTGTVDNLAPVMLKFDTIYIYVYLRPPSCDKPEKRSELVRCQHFVHSDCAAVAVPS